MNGRPSWSELFAILSTIENRLGGLNAGQRMMHASVQTGFDRVHQRIDDLHQHGQTHIDTLQERVTTLEVQRTAQVQASRSTGLLAKLRDVAETIAPLKELVALAVVILASAAGIAQAPAVKAVLVAIAAALHAG